MMYPVLDYITHGKNSVVFINPPKADLEGFKVVECAEQKLRELVDRLDEIKNNYHKNCEVIRSNTDGFSTEFYITLESYRATEMIYTKKWIRYWLRLYEQSTKTEVIEKPKDSITNEHIERAKEFPIEEMYNNELRTGYGRLVGLCPFHDEKTPSFTIFTNDNRFRCFGCQRHGDAIDFYQLQNNVSFIEAVRSLHGN